MCYCISRYRGYLPQAVLGIIPVSFVNLNPDPRFDRQSSYARPLDGLWRHTLGTLSDWSLPVCDWKRANLGFFHRWDGDERMSLVRLSYRADIG